MSIEETSTLKHCIRGQAAAEYEGRMTHVDGISKDTDEPSRVGQNVRGSQ